MADQFLARGTKKAPHGVRFHLRDGRPLEGRVFLTERDCWVPFLANRKRSVSVTDAVWPGLGEEPLQHVVLPTANILWAAPLERAAPLVHVPPAAKGCPVELQLEGGVILRGVVNLVPPQRLSEYFDAADAFLPVIGARVQPRGPELGELAVSTAAICALRELDPGRD